MNDWYTLRYSQLSNHQRLIATAHIPSHASVGFVPLMCMYLCDASCELYRSMFFQFDFPISFELLFGLQKRRLRVLCTVLYATLIISKFKVFHNIWTLQELTAKYLVFSFACLYCRKNCSFQLLQKVSDPSSITASHRSEGENVLGLSARHAVCSALIWHSGSHGGCWPCTPTTIGFCRSAS